jgi:hypothetical protein
MVLPGSMSDERFDDAVTLAGHQLEGVLGVGGA